MNRVEFPFLVLLISGGHSLLAVVRGVDDFLLLGKGLDDAPGEAFDKVIQYIISVFHRFNQCIIDTIFLMFKDPSEECNYM